MEEMEEMVDVAEMVETLGMVEMEPTLRYAPGILTLTSVATCPISISVYLL